MHVHDYESPSMYLDVHMYGHNKSITEFLRPGQEVTRSTQKEHRVTGWLHFRIHKVGGIVDQEKIIPSSVTSIISHFTIFTPNDPRMIVNGTIKNNINLII